MNGAPPIAVVAAARVRAAARSVLPMADRMILGRFKGQGQAHTRQEHRRQHHPRRRYGPGEQEGDEAEDEGCAQDSLSRYSLREPDAQNPTHKKAASDGAQSRGCRGRAQPGLCHTDEHMRNGDIGFAAPMVGGHEGSRVVEEVGPGVTHIKPRDHFVTS